jgi:lipoprotein NlpI
VERQIDWQLVTCSNYFVQHVLRNGTTEFKQPIVQRLMHDVVALSTDNHGSHVVQLCFKDLDVQLLCNVLTAFCELTERQLAEMVRGRSSKYVLHKLLDTGYTVSGSSLYHLAAI